MKTVCNGNRFCSIGLFTIFFVMVIWSLKNTVVFDYSSYGMTEFLVNYEGGFVRRGLLGEILYNISKFTGIEPGWIITIVSWIFYLCSLAWFLKKCVKRNYNWWLIISPLMFGLTLYVIRKDFLILCIFIEILNLLKDNHVGIGKRITVIILLILTLFIHEGSFFYVCPVTLILLYTARPYNRNVTIVAGLLVVTCFLLLSCYKGDVDQAHLIQNSWHELFPEKFSTVPSGTIYSIGWEIIPTIKYHLTCIFNMAPLGLWWIPLQIIFFVLTFYVTVGILFTGKNGRTEENRCHDIRMMCVLWGMILVFMSPLFLALSCDYDRLYFYLVTTSVAVYFSVPSERYDLELKRFNGVWIKAYGRVCQILPGPDSRFFKSDACHRLE